ncbi:MAG TPA: hypothetical protein VJS67_07195 [Pseudonocardiaceae bacterium]|nr:hypothetical protein [Pseudonocardiaceae bacterium]
MDVVIEQRGKDVTEVNATGSDPARRRSHWPWVVTVLFGIVGVASAVVRSRWPSSKPKRSPVRPDHQLTWRYREAVATGRSPTGNGVVRAHHHPGPDSP